MMASLFLLGARHRAVVAALVVFVTLLTALGLGDLKIDTSFDSLIPEDDPGRLVYRKVMGEFGSDNKTIIYIGDDELWSTAKLSRLEKLHTGLKRLDHVSRVDSLFTLRTIEGDTKDGLPSVSAQALINGVPTTQLLVDEIKRRALENPLYIGNLFSADGDATAMIVTMAESPQDVDFNPALYANIEALLAEQRDGFEKLFQVGPPRINAELRSSIAEDFRLLGPLSAIVLILSILLFMRSGLAALIPLVTSALTIVWTFGMLGWTGVPLNLLSAMIPSLIIVIGSTEDTHMMAAFFRGLANSDKSGLEAIEPNPKHRAIAYMALHTGLPLILTVMTTALGFASNLFSSIGLIQDFAIASTFAIVANGVITILVVPLLLSQFGLLGLNAEQAAEKIYGNSISNRIIASFRVSQDKFPLITLGVTAVLCAFFTYQASKLYVTNDPLSYFPEDRPLIQETRLIHDELAGIKVFFVSLESAEERAFLEPENLRKIDAIQAFMNKQAVYDSTLSIVDHLKYVNREFQGQFAQLSLPKTRPMVAQYLMFFHRSELETYVSHDYKRANIIVRHNITDSYTLNKYIAELEQAVNKMTGPELAGQVVGENLMVNQAAESLMLSQVKALGLLLVLIFIMMSIMFTSIKGGLIAMIPSLMPIMLMFGLMGFLKIPLNPGTAMVAVIAVGIAIDGTIHLLARYQELCSVTSDYKGAVKEAVGEVATPLIISSLALSFGFGILLFSNFTVVAQFGALAAATMLISIFANLLITPIIM
ncbi:MAG: MMPL family transporter, partial [Pseudomonadales bacterium]